MSSSKTALLVSGLFALFVVGAGMAIFGPSIPVYERLFGISTQEAGLVVSTLWLGCLGGVVGMFFKGAVATPRHALGLMTLGSVILAVAPLWSVTLAGALIYGVGYGAAAALYNPRFLVVFQETGPSKLSLLNAVGSGGAIVAPWVFALVGGEPRPVFWGMAAISGLTFAISGPVGLVGVEPSAVGRGFRLHWPILIFALVAIGIEASLGGLGPTALIRAGVEEGRASELLAVFFVAALAARVALIFLAAKVPDFGVYLFAVGWTCLCSLGAALISAPVFFPLLGLSAGMFFQGEYVTASRLMGDDPRVSPIILAMGLVGAIFAPAIYAALMDHFGSHGFFWLVALVSGLATLAALAGWRSIAPQRSQA